MPDDNTLKPLAMLTTTSKDNSIWKGSSFVGLTDEGRALEAGKYVLCSLDAAQAEVDKVRLRGVELIGERDARIAELELAAMVERNRSDIIEWQVARIAALEAELRVFEGVGRNAVNSANEILDRMLAAEARVAELRQAAEKVIQMRYRYGWSPEADSVIWDLGAHVPGWDAAIAASGEGKA